MGVLTDADITNALERGDLEIEPFSEDQLTPNGYDLAIAEVLLPDTGQRFVGGTALVPPMTRFLVSTRERVRLGPALVAQLWLRTSWARRGVLASFGRVDAGFDGTLTFAALNTSSSVLPVPMGETFAQLVVEPLTGKARSLYADRSGHYQDQRGVTLAVPTGGTGGGRLPRLDAPCLEAGCHECCLETEMPLSRLDVERLEALGHPRQRFAEVEDGFTFLANIEGRCFFLDAEGSCSVYADRPEGCRLYPLVMDEAMSGFRLDDLCPHRDRVDWREIHETALMELLGRLADERESGLDPT